MTWRYYAMRALGGQWVHRELPLADVTVSHTLSGPGGLSATIEPEYADLIGPDGQPVLQEWGTIILAEASGQLRGGGILTGTEVVGPKLSLDCVGFSGYAHGMPLTSTLSWGGSTAGTTGQGVDPADVIRALWDHLQAQPDGHLGVTYSTLATPYRLGEWHNARKLPTDDEPSPDPREIQDPPIPIDRVWTPQDRRPAAATGQQVYWSYRLPWYEDIEVGAHIDQLCTQAHIDYRETYTWASPEREAVVMRLVLGYPRLGRRQSGLVFVEGENITEVVAIRRSGDDYANSVAAYGAGEGSKQLRATVSRRDGRLRRVQTVDAPDITTAAALRALASEELRQAQHLTDITSFVVRDHPNAPVGSFSVGDDVLVQTGASWSPTRLWVRILSYDLDPDTSHITITCSRSDRFRYDAGGQ